jgi:DNA-binding NarL/FixJ family response regulator
MSSTVFGQPARRMLLVEDDAQLRYAMEALLEPFFEIQTAPNGESAEHWFTNRRFDVALVDYLLPDMNGVEVLRRLRAAAPDVRRILTSGWFLPELFSSTANGLIHGFVLKPTSLDAIVEVCSFSPDDPRQLAL